jgi:multisubunit Na+/H+ antiporter MnhC subunit
MEIFVAITIGILVATGLYRLLGGCKVDIIIGLILLSQAANLIILASGGLKHNAAALVGDDPDLSSFADPLPQALVLTAIVIGFGILAFLLTLLIRSPK